jgi:hypothetical protein
VIPLSADQSDDLRAALASMRPVSLPELNAAAALLHRVDRKYLVPLGDARTLVERLAASHRVLEIEGRRSTSYRSTYLDTVDLRSCRDHVQGRRLRWKVRSRLYVEDSVCRFEVKVKNGRAETIKHGLVVERLGYGRYGDQERLFTASVLGDVPPLYPNLEVRYERATLAHLEGAARVTIDLGVTGTVFPGTPCRLRQGTVAFSDDVTIVETKGTSTLSTADRVLRELGHRPRALSKYATSVSLLSRVADNDVRRLVGSRVHVTTEPSEKRDAS